MPRANANSKGAEAPRRRPRTGEARKANQPFKIDRLPSGIHDAIKYLYGVAGKTWEEIEAQSAEKYSPSWKVNGGGFINWKAISPDVLELFPDKKLPHTSLHRWFDVRINQVGREVRARSAQARELAEAFSQSVVEGGDQAILNAARDTFMSVLAEDNSTKGRGAAGKALIALAEVMQTARGNDIRERKVAVEERRIAQLEKDAELKRKRFQKEMDAAEKKVTSGEALTVDDINKIREKVFGIGPAPVASNA